MDIILRADNSVAHLTLPSDYEAVAVRSALPGVSWDAVNRVWNIPVTRRTCLRLREFLRGKKVDIDPTTAKMLANAADGLQSPDITICRDRICIKFEFHKEYQDFALSLAASKRVDGTWSLPLSSAEDMLARLESLGIDLLPSPEVRALAKPLQLPGFIGAITSLQRTPWGSLRYITERNNIFSKKKLKPLEDRLYRMGVDTPYEVLMSFPLRYIDRSTPSGVLDLIEGEEGVVLGTIIQVDKYDRTRQLLKVIIEDEAKHRLTIPIFRQPWLSGRFFENQRVIVSGKYRPYRPSNGRVIPQMTDARIDSLDAGAGKMLVIPIYQQSSTLNVTTWDISALTKEILSRADVFTEELPEELITKHHLCSMDEAIRNIHYPQSMSWREKAMDRLIYEELLGLQVYIQTSKKNYEQAHGISQPVKENGYYQKFLSGLPYTLTNAQERVLAEIGHDLASGKPMHRLLQGDVSSGKTTIAHALMFSTIDNGHQGVILAPTEILAEQLYLSLAAAAPDGIRVEFLGLKTTKKARVKIIEGLADGSVHALVGTHAILQDDVKFIDLATVVIDEQHRFGTAQRSVLRARRSDKLVPDMLVMTATPIPRTASIVLYGDMDLSILDELPPGRVPIETEWIDVDSTDVLNDRGSRVWKDIRNRVTEGRQAYVVASLIEDNETIAAASTLDAFTTLNNGALKGLRLGIVHGRMPRSEREVTMRAFSSGEIDVLVSTTVIEVGVNVPNATVMVVLDAGRFGIAQLHQIRGRVGRASYPSMCYLIGSAKTDNGTERLTSLVQSTDGFFLAEKDLEIRGEGTLFGTKQSGVSDLRIASLRRDLAVLEEAKVDAEQIVAQPGKYGSMINRIIGLYDTKEIDS